MNMCNESHRAAWAARGQAGKLLIFQRLDERSVHRRFRGPDGGDKRCGQNGRHGRQDNVRRERIVQAHPADIVVLPAPLGGSALCSTAVDPV